MVGVAGAAGRGTRGRGLRPSHKEPQFMPAASTHIQGGGVLFALFS